MPQTLEIPQQTPDLDMVLERMLTRENAKHDPNAIGKAGEVGLFQIMPQTAKGYGVDPSLLKNPVVNRYVAKRYMSDLLSKYKGNLPLALAAYNAGPGNVDKGAVPTSTKGYVRKILDSLSGAGTSDAGAAEAPPPPPGFKLDAPPPPPGFKLDGAPAVGPAAPPARPPVAKEPFAVKAAGYLPAAGQMGGEALGAMGGAAIPGADLSGVPEYAGAVAGGAAGSAGGAYLQNKVRGAYNLPPVSVGKEALYGGATSAIGGALPFIPRLRKVSAIRRATGKSFSEAMAELRAVEGGLEGTLGMGARKAKLLESAPGTQVTKAYEATRAGELRSLGAEYDNVLKPWAHTRTPQTALNTLNGIAGKKLALAGGHLPSELAEEFRAQPMTVRRVQQLIGYVKAKQRKLNPETQAVARSAYDDIIKALERDRDAIIGPNAAAQIKNLDFHYARKIAQYPIKAVRRAFTEPSAAEAILKAKAGDTGRVLEVIKDMEGRGQIDALRRATATRIYQKAAKEAAANPIDNLKALRKAVGSMDPSVFDALYGKGSRELWTSTADSLIERQKELLKNPTQAAAVAKAVNDYLKGPTVPGGLINFLKHHAIWTVAGIGAGAVYAPKELAIAGSALVGAKMYDVVAHSQVAMRLLRLASHSREAQQTARLIIAAMNAAARTAVEGPAKPEEESSATP